MHTKQILHTLLWNIEKRCKTEKKQLQLHQQPKAGQNTQHLTKNYFVEFHEKEILTNEVL